MGGPFWAAKDAGAWTIPKGEHDENEDALAAAEREFREETGHAVPDGERVALGEVRQRSGKTVTAWAVEGDLDPSDCVSDTIEIEWPPRSGRVLVVPEIDRMAWVDLDRARDAVVSGQRELFDRLERLLRP